MDRDANVLVVAEDLEGLLSPEEVGIFRREYPNGVLVGDVPQWNRMVYSLGVNTQRIAYGLGLTTVLYNMEDRGGVSRTVYCFGNVDDGGSMPAMQIWDLDGEVVRVLHSDEWSSE